MVEQEKEKQREEEQEQNKTTNNQKGIEYRTKYSSRELFDSKAHAK